MCNYTLKGYSLALKSDTISKIEEELLARVLSKGSCHSCMILYVYLVDELD